MPSRKVLKSVAHGIADSFTSRNNDADGYWAIGLLLQQAIIHEQDAFVFDLLGANASSVFCNGPLQNVPARYRALLWKQLPYQQWLQKHLTAGVVKIVFDLANKKLISGQKEQILYAFTCYVQLTDDCGRTYERKLSYWCWPHNPAWESKSNRTYVPD